MSETGSENAVKLEHRPKDTRFRQQRIKAWRPILTARGVFPIFLGIGALFLPLGVVFLVVSSKVSETVIEYTHCERIDGSARTFCSEEVRTPAFYLNYESCPCQINFTLDTPMSGTVYLYYGLSNFFQNHRRYVLSKDDKQLHGEIGTLSADCNPYRLNPDGKKYAPCGAIAMSLFNDTFTLKYRGSDSDSLSASEEVPMTKEGIAWPSDVEKKYGIPPASSWDDTVKPDSWKLNATERSKDAYKGDEELIVWMRTAALPTFRKLYRKLIPQGRFTDGLPAGNYSIDVGYAYPVTQFGGTKRIIISTSSWLGARNPSLGIAYIVVGCVCLVLGIFFLVLHFRLPRSVRD
ncbi:unnamed protein product [Calicophoron daubneyi]|uniref:Cell cycle control protein 50A n=1 Tax=Calicophoron daubneyi TaxID=300641 RepID=A0AAV2TQ45_CALDB